jgi:surface polysaccharide O-acyltransferase-like enzyme
VTEDSIPCNRKEIETRLERKMDGNMRTGRERQQRNLGIDLLRIFCMFLICILHVCGQGRAMVRYAGREEVWYSVYILETAAYCAVNTYGMISGYVGVRSVRRPSRIVELWLRVFWYSALGTLIAVTFFHLPVESDTLYQALLPTMWKTYWYFSSYVGVFVIEPYLNRLVKSLGSAGKKKLMITLFLLCSVFTMVPRVANRDFLGIGAGYSFLWLSVMYIIGACVRELTNQNGPERQKQECSEPGGAETGITETETTAGVKEQKEDSEKNVDFLHRSGGFYGMLYIICVLVTWISKILIENWTTSVYGEARYGRLLFSYASPTIVICAFCLLMIFSRLKCRGRVLRGLIRFFSPLAFSVYLLQLQPYFWEYVLAGRYQFIAKLGPAAACLMVLVMAAALYLECTAVDLVRMAAFRLLRIRRVAQVITDFALRPFAGLTEQENREASGEV